MEKKLSLRTNYRLQKTLRFVLIALVIGWLIFSFLLYPNVDLIRTTLFQDGKLQVNPIIQVFTSSRVQKSLWNSFILAISLTLTVNILGIFQVLILDYFNIKGNKWLSVAYHAPLICNGMVLVLAYNFVYGGNGFLTTVFTRLFPDMNPLWFQGFWAVLIEMTFSGTSNHIMIVRDALHAIDYQTIEAAQSMGIKPWRVLIKVVLPTLRPSLFAASILTFITGVSAFATPQVLGGPEFETINPLVRSFANTLTTRHYAAILAIFLGIVTIIVMTFSNYIERRKNYRSVSKTKIPLRKQNIQSAKVRIPVTILAHLIAILQVLPLFFVVLFSFMSAKDLYAGKISFARFTLDNYKTVFNSTLGARPVLTSLIYSAVSSIAIVALMLFIGRIITKYKNRLTRTLEAVLQIPWFLPSTLIALAMVMTFSAPKAFLGNRVLTGTLYLLPIGYMVIKTPYTLRMIKAAYATLDESIEEAAKNLGASSMKTYVKVLLPILWPDVLSVFLLNFIGLLGEYSLSVFLFHPRYQPLGVALNAAASPDATPEAAMLSFVYAVLIMAISTLTILFIYNRKGKIKK